MSTAPPETTPATSRRPLGPRQIALAGLIGTTIEWFDFFIYGTAAALVFAHQFFPSVSPTAGTIASLSTFAVGFVARPLGGAVMGHLGDRIGRKRMLVVSLLTMGGATALIGLLPTYQTIGLAAPLLLVVLRFLQGFGVGGEWGGAVLMSLEHAPPNRRVLYASFPQLGLPAGIVLASLAFLALQLTIDTAAFLAWGWRVPFLVSAVLVVFGLILRSRTDESPEFVAASRRNQVARVPIIDLFRSMPLTVVQAAGVSVVLSAFGNIVFVFCLTYAVQMQLASSTDMLAITIAAAIVGAIGIYAGATLAQRFGRKRMLLGNLALCIVWAFPLFLLIDTGSLPLIAFACIVAGWLQGFGSGPLAAVLAEAFPVPLRYTGASIAYGLGGVAGGALAPLIATALLASFGSSIPISVYLVVLGAVSLVAVATLRMAPEPGATTTSISMTTTGTGER